MDNIHYTEVMGDDGIPTLIIHDVPMEVVMENGVPTIVIADEVADEIVRRGARLIEEDHVDEPREDHVDGPREDRVDGEDECSICLLPLNTYGVVLKMSVCTHFFHPNCIGRWAIDNSRCALCRQDIDGWTFEKCE